MSTPASNTTTRPGTRAKTRVKGPEQWKQFPVYQTEKEMLEREGATSQVVEQNIEHLMDKQRSTLAVPTVAKPDEQSKQTNGVNEKAAQNAESAPTNERTQYSSTPISPDQKEEDLPPPCPIVKINLQYPPVDEITKSGWYVKHIPTIYTDNILFSFQDEDYELSVQDREFFKTPEAQVELSSITEKDFERIIDCLEKVAFLYKDRSPTKVAEHFYEHADLHLRNLKKSIINFVTIQYWKKRRMDQKPWHCLNRKFWENPDFNETDLSAAFRKRSEKEKIKLRPKLEIHRKKLYNGEKARNETMKFVLESLLPDLFLREAQKQSLDRNKNAQFDLKFEAMCKKQGVVSKYTQEKKPFSYFEPQNWQDHLELKIKLPQPQLPAPSEDFNGHLSPKNNANNTKERRNGVVPSIPRGRPIYNDDVHENPSDNLTYANNQIRDRDRSKNKNRSILTSQGHEGAVTPPSQPKVITISQPENNNIEDVIQNDIGVLQQKRSNKQAQSATLSRQQSVSNNQRSRQPNATGREETKEEIETVREIENTQDYVQIDAQTIESITRLYALVKESGIEMSNNKYIQPSFQNAVDIQPKVPSIFEPGPAFKQAQQHEAEPEMTSETDMLNQVAKRKFVVVRGRNDRCLMRAIQMNVFDDKNDELPKIQNPNKGQAYYVEKYNKTFKLGKRAHDEEQGPQNRGRKRAKFSNFEHCLIQQPFLKDRIKLLSGYYNTLMSDCKQIKEIDFKQVVKAAGISSKLLKEKPANVNHQVSEGSRDSQNQMEDDEHISQQQIFETERLTAYDFVSRGASAYDFVNRSNQKSLQRQFLLSLCNQKQSLQQDGSDEEMITDMSPAAIKSQVQSLSKKFELFTHHQQNSGTGGRFRVGFNQNQPNDQSYQSTEESQERTRQ